jgi:hypothetical protein
MNTLCCGYVGDIRGDYRGSNRGEWVATSTHNHPHYLVKM